MHRRNPKEVPKTQRVGESSTPGKRPPKKKGWGRCMREHSIEKAKHKTIL